MTKNLDYFLGLRYRIELQAQEEGGYVAHHPELPGCIAQGETAEETVDSLRDAREAWLEVRLEDGLPVPEPREEPTYSGKFVLRMPKSLHQELAEAAERDGVSLNQFVVAALSRHVWNREEERVTEYHGFGGWNRQARVVPRCTQFYVPSIASYGIGVPPSVIFLDGSKSPTLDSGDPERSTPKLRLVQA